MSKAAELEQAATALEVAAEHMRMHGRCTGSFQDNSGRVCAVGAINIGVGQVLGVALHDATGVVWDKDYAEAFANLKRPVLGAVLDQLRKAKVTNEDEIYVWNDAARRRMHDVIEVFNRAEAKLRETAQALRDLGQAE